MAADLLAKARRSAAVFFSAPERRRKNSHVRDARVAVVAGARCQATGFTWHDSVLESHHLAPSHGVREPRSKRHAPSSYSVTYSAGAEGGVASPILYPIARYARIRFSSILARTGTFSSR
jgi:hypothetical protein